jgi:hypothetical protein
MIYLVHCLKFWKVEELELFWGDIKEEKKTEVRNWEEVNMEKCLLQLQNVLLSFLLSDSIAIEI